MAKIYIILILAMSTHNDCQPKTATQGKSENAIEKVREKFRVEETSKSREVY